MKINSKIDTDALSEVICVLINGGAQMVEEKSSLKEATASAVHQKVDELYDTFNSNQENSKSSDIKSGIYSIVYAGLSSGLEGIENEDANISEALEISKNAVLSKTKEVLPEMLCDRIQKNVSDSFAQKHKKLESKKYKTDAVKKADLFATDSTQTLLNKGIENLHGFLDGSMSAQEIIENSVTETVDEIKHKAIDGVVSKATEKFGISGEAIDTAKNLINGEMSLTEAATQKVGELSKEAINDYIVKACEKLKISKYLDLNELTATAENVKEHFKEYINGEITDTQFFLKIGQDGLFQVSQAWGTSIGTSISLSMGMKGVAAALTQAASSTIVTAVYSELYKYAMNVFEEEMVSSQRLNEIRVLSQEAINVIKEEREFLLNSTFIESEKRQKVFKESLISLATALDTNNIDLLTSALNTITAEVGGTIQFKNFEEFDEFMMDDSLVLEF